MGGVIMSKTVYQDKAACAKNLVIQINPNNKEVLTSVPSVTSLSNGNLLTIWGTAESGISIVTMNIYGKIITQSGNVIVDTFFVDSGLTQDIRYGDNSINPIPLKDGNFAISYSKVINETVGPIALGFQKFNESAKKIGNFVSVQEDYDTGSAEQYLNNFALSFPNGNFGIMGANWQNTGQNFQEFNPEGKNISTPVNIPLGAGPYGMTALSDNGFAVTYRDFPINNQNVSVLTDVYNSSKIKIGNNSFSSKKVAGGEKDYSAVSSLSNGNILTAWIETVSDEDCPSFNADSCRIIKGEIIDINANSVIAPFNITSIADLSSDGISFSNLQIAALSNGNSIVSWSALLAKVTFFFQEINDKGAKIGNTFKNGNHDITGATYLNKICEMESSKFATTWLGTKDINSTANDEIYLSIFDCDNNPNVPTPAPSHNIPTTPTFGPTSAPTPTSTPSPSNHNNNGNDHHHWHGYDTALVVVGSLAFVGIVAAVIYKSGICSKFHHGTGELGGDSLPINTHDQPTYNGADDVA
ncbi:MAG: hypothetical protein ACI8ZF_001002 [Candidatus Midichloriaceae bacterium]